MGMFCYMCNGFVYEEVRALRAVEEAAQAWFDSGMGTPEMERLHAALDEFYSMPNVTRGYKVCNHACHDEARGKGGDDVPS